MSDDRFGRRTRYQLIRAFGSLAVGILELVLIARAIGDRATDRAMFAARMATASASLPVAVD